MGKRGAPASQRGASRHCVHGDWVASQTRAATPAHPNWARECVLALRDAGLARGGRTVQFRVWSDCAGLATEMFAAAELCVALRDVASKNVSFTLFCACDADPVCRKLIGQNHGPVHVTHNVHDRDFRAATHSCSSCGVVHELADVGIDVYVAGFPCTPNSRRGTRKGFAHPDAGAVMAGAKTLGLLKPAMWLYENAQGVADVRAGESESDLDRVRRLIAEHSDAPYVTRVVQHMSPTWTGYPTCRPRVFVLGWRADLGSEAAFVAPLNALLAQAPVPALNYMAFLRLESRVDWSRVHASLTSSERSFVQTSGCSCSVSPYSICDVHRCACGRCGGDGLQCTWRKKMVTYVRNKFVDAEATLGNCRRTQLTYIQVLEQQGQPTPQSQRVRNLLNVFALLPDCNPLSRTLAIADVSQGIDRTAFRLDGNIPTVAKNSELFSLGMGRFLTTCEVAALMGFKLDLMNLKGVNEAAFRRILGNTIHVSSAGAMLLALVGFCL